MKDPRSLPCLKGLKSLQKVTFRLPSCAHTGRRFYSSEDHSPCHPNLWKLPKRPSRPPSPYPRRGQEETQEKEGIFSLYIFKVLKQVHPVTGVSSKAMSIMNSSVFQEIILFNNMPTNKISHLACHSSSGTAQEEAITLVKLIA